MVVSMNVHAQRPELSNEFIDLPFSGIPTHVADVFVAGPSHHLVNGSGEPVSDSDLCFIG